MDGDRIRELESICDGSFASPFTVELRETLAALRDVTAQNEALREVAEVVKRIPPAVNLSGMVEVRAWARDLIQAARVALEVP